MSNFFAGLGHFIGKVWSYHPSTLESWAYWVSLILLAVVVILALARVKAPVFDWLALTAAGAILLRAVASTDHPAQFWSCLLLALCVALNPVRNIRRRMKARKAAAAS